MSEVSINNVALSQSRFERIEGAQTLNEAQRMGLFDRVVDWCRGGVKREAIKQAFDLLHAPGGGAPPSQHEGLLLHFNFLQSALRAEHTDKCQLTVQRDDDAQTWSYRMEIDGKTLVSATGLPMQSGHTLTAFEDHAMLANLGSYLQQEFGADSVDQRALLQEEFAAINAGHAELAGDAAASATLEKFRVVCASLEQLGAPAKGCFPAVQPSTDLSTAELSVGNHVLGTYAISSQAVLTDTLSTLAEVSAGAVDYMLQARDVNKAVLDTVQDMVDDSGERDLMQENIRDPFFCRTNFVSARMLDGDDSKFVATFRDDSAAVPEQTLVFSNRISTNGELRGANLQAKLATGTYASLADLISQRLGTAEDAEITYLTTAARFGLINALSSMESNAQDGAWLGFSDEDEVHQYFQGLKDNVLRPITLGLTDLAHVWRLDTTLFGSMSQKQGPEQEPKSESVTASGNVPQPSPAEPQLQEMAMLASFKA